MGRPEPARGDEQVARKPVADRALELAGGVADDPQLGRLDAGGEQRLREVGPVAVGPFAAHELRAGDDDAGAQPAQALRTPLAVTVSEAGRSPPSGTRLPPTVMTRFSGELMLIQKSLPWRPVNGSRLPLSIVPAKRSCPPGPPRCTAT